MRKLLLAFVATLFLMTNNSCTNQEVGKQEEPELTEKQIRNLTEGWIFFVAAATRTHGNVTEDLMQDSINVIYRNVIFLTFFDKNIYYFTGTEIPNDQFAPTAKTFNIRTRIMLPTNVSTVWDEARKTIAFNTASMQQPLPIPEGKTAYLDNASVNLYKSFEEAKAAAVPGSMKINFDDVDPKLGAVTYTFTLKPLWFYYQAPMDQNYKKFVVF